jgi:hypothetical protein
MCGFYAIILTVNMYLLAMYNVFQPTYSKIRYVYKITQAGTLYLFGAIEGSSAKIGWLQYIIMILWSVTTDMA